MGFECQAHTESDRRPTAKAGCNHTFHDNAPALSVIASDSEQYNETRHPGESRDPVLNTPVAVSPAIALAAIVVGCPQPSWVAPLIRNIVHLFCPSSLLTRSNTTKHVIPAKAGIQIPEDFVFQLTAEEKPEVDTFSSVAYNESKHVRHARRDLCKPNLHCVSTSG